MRSLQQSRELEGLSPVTTGREAKITINADLHNYDKNNTPSVIGIGAAYLVSGW